MKVKKLLTFFNFSFLQRLRLFVCGCSYIPNILNGSHEFEFAAANQKTNPPIRVQRVDRADAATNEITAVTQRTMDEDSADRNPPSYREGCLFLRRRSRDAARRSRRRDDAGLTKCPSKKTRERRYGDRRMRRRWRRKDEVV